MPAGRNGSGRPRRVNGRERRPILFREFCTVVSMAPAIRAGLPLPHVGEAAGSIAQIDGLRGIAVLAVVVYHFLPQWAGGGFVGVDIFFVISGFLIGGILWRELSLRGTINYGAFLMRRVRRLAPAYFTMVAASALAAYFILLPFEFREFGKSLIASILYMSNIQFFREAGYFDIASESKVLLHTWSLSVEEQFYLVMPLLLILLGRRKRLLVGVLIALFCASLASSILLTPVSPTATFFLFPFRAWELLIGVLLAVAWAELGLSGKYGSVPSWLGLGLIALSIVLIRSNANFPGALALLPTLGTALIIVNMFDRNAVNAMLASKPLVSVGLISYSLYIWHWPVLTLSSYYRDEYASAFETSLWLGLCFVLATLSWRFVEQPVRHARTLSSLRLVSASMLASAALLAVGVLTYVGNGLPDRFGAQTRLHIQASADFIQDWGRCGTASEGPLAGVDLCRIGPEGEPSFLVWGDSHVRAFKEGIEQAALEAGRPGLLIWRAGCPPLFDIKKQESATTKLQDDACTEANALIRQALPKLSSISKILLVGRWSYYAQGAGVGGDAVNTIALSPAAETANPGQKNLFHAATLNTIREISREGRQVYVLEQVPEIPRYDSRDVAKRLAHGYDELNESQRFVAPLADVLARSADSDAPFLELAAANQVIVLKTRDRFCDQSVCTVIHDGKSYYFDNNHITNTAAIAIRDVFSPVMREAGNLPSINSASLHD